MTTVPGTVSDDITSLSDYNLIHLNVHDLREAVLSGRYPVTDCGDGILASSTFEEQVEECDYAKDPSGPNMITYPHIDTETAFNTVGATYN